jgi:hypothetical protein
MVNYRSLKQTLKLAGALFAGAILPACSPSPESGPSKYSFTTVPSYTVREHIFRITPTYDLIDKDNHEMGRMSRNLFTLTRHTDIQANNHPVGSIETKIFSIGHDMTVWDENEKVINTVDHKILSSLLNFGGFYMEIKDPSGQLVGTLKKDSFALFTQSAWKYFDIKGKNGETLAKIECTSLFPDAYRVDNLTHTLDNRTLAGVVSILDQLADNNNRKHKSSHKSKSRR